jgi:hypothetical protein
VPTAASRRVRPLHPNPNPLIAYFESQSSQQEKVTLSAPAQVHYAEQRHNIHDRKHYRPRGTGMHPVLGRYTDPQKVRAWDGRESRRRGSATPSPPLPLPPPPPPLPRQEFDVTSKDHQRTLYLSNRGRDQQLRNQQDHDILTKLPAIEPPPPPPPQPVTRTFASGAPFDILSGDPVPPDLQSDAARNARPPRPMVNYAPSLVRRRAVDILSNHYLQDDEGKAARDAARAREKSLLRYWQTHNFDPITQTYYDGEKEAAARQVAALSTTVQGVAQRARLPTSIRVSTGQAYDIVGHITRDEDTLNTIDLMDTRALRVRTRHLTEERLHSAGEARASVEDVRAASRTRQRRYEEFSDPRGYDILSGQSRDQGLLDRTLAGREVRPWDRITRDLQSAPAGVGGGGGGASGSWL